MIHASICTIGDEILIGQIVDTNSAAISRALGALGVRVSRMVSLPDDGDAIVRILTDELRGNDIVITTGGLGPTKDDITKPALAALSGSRGYVTHEEQLAIIHRILESRGLDVLDINRAQASVPDTCEVIPNRAGTAPIMVFRFPEERFGHSCVLYAMPGVPFETERALPDVMEDIRRHHALSAIHHRTLMTYGMAESALAKKIGTWEDALPEDMHLAYLPNPLTGVRLRLSVYGGGPEVMERMETQIAALKALLGDLVYADGDSSLEEALGGLLKAHGKTLSAAESCTGGEISHLITTVAGSSAYYLGSVTSYAVSVKEKVLGVPRETIARHGVVSSEVAAAMAEGVRRVTGSDYAVSTTGLAGPGGGDGVYPEGTVWVGVATPQGVMTRKFQYQNDRKRNIQRFAASALYFLLLEIKKDLNI